MESQREASPLLYNYFPLPYLREELNTMGSYMCWLAQKSANTNWLARRSYWHEFTGSSHVHGCLSQPEGSSTGLGVRIPLAPPKKIIPHRNIEAFFELSVHWDTRPVGQFKLP